MPRQKYQRPEVYADGKREKVWKAEYREYYIDAGGEERSRHKAVTWPQREYTKSQAQAECDKFMARVQGGSLHGDGAMTLERFWDDIYYPIRSRHWTGGTPAVVLNLWRNHIQPKLGSVPLKDVSKAMIQIHLGRMADAGLGKMMVDGARVRLYSILEEALDNDLIQKNPCRKVETPPCKPPEETRSLSEAEVRALWDGTEGRDYLFWRVMILTGARIGEVLAFKRADVMPAGLSINQAIVGGLLKLPKRNKTRMAPLPDSLRAELVEWLSSHDSTLMFPSLRGKVHRRSSKEICAIETRGRAIIPGLTFRMCRTTFATLFDGDEADRTSIMGHFDVKFTLEKYRKPLDARRKEAVEALDRRLKVVEIKKRA